MHPPGFAEERARRLVGRTVLGRYRLGEPVAARGDGALFLAEHVQTGRPALAEVLYPEAAAPAAVARLERAALAGAQIEHPGIAAARDLGVLEDGARVLVSDPAPGPTLRELLARGPMHLARALGLAGQLAGALAALHARGIAHLGVSPDLVRVAPQEGPSAVKLVDLGGAWLPPDLLAAAAHTEGLTLLGRPGAPPEPTALRPPSPYDAPEIAGGGIAALSPRGGAPADVFSLGLVLAELVTGAPPHAVRPALALPGSRPPALDALLARMLAERPEERPTASEVAQALGALAVAPAASPGLSPRPPLASGLGADATFLARAPVAPASHPGHPGHPIAASQAAIAVPTPTPGRASVAVSAASATSATPSAAALPAAAASSPALAPLPLAARRGYVASLPLSLRAGVFGSGAIVGVILFAIGLRPPLDALESAAAAAPATGTAAASDAESRPSADPKAAAAAPAPGIACETRVSPAEARAKLVRAAQAKRYREFRGAVEGVVCAGPISATDEKDVQAALFDILQDVMVGRTSNVVSEDDVDRIFSIVGRNTGTLGPDVFFQLVTTRSSMGAKRAKHELKDAAVRERGTPAMRVAYDAYAAGASCEALQPLFERIKTNGDRRVLRPVLGAHDRCDRKSAGCCADLRELLDHLKERGVIR